MGDKLNCALDLMRRLPPADVEDNLEGLIDLAPDLCEELLSAVDQPLKIAHDAEAKRDYLKCDYNRDADSYRSPWSNKYDPPLDDGSMPSPQLREIEVQANEVFDIYRDLYFEGGISSVYLWDQKGSPGFAACILFKKTQDQSKKGQPMRGTWDSIHVVEVNDKGKTASYTLTSTVMLSLETKTESTGTVNLAGSLVRRAEQDFPVDKDNPHVTNIGRMVEEMEIKLRQTLETIYFGKTKTVATSLRSTMSKDEQDQRNALAGELANTVKRRGPPGPGGK